MSEIKTEEFKNNVNKEEIEKAIESKNLKIKKSTVSAKKNQVIDSKKKKIAKPPVHQIAWSYETMTVTINSGIRDQILKDLKLVPKDTVITVQSYKDGIVTMKLCKTQSEALKKLGL